MKDIDNVLKIVNLNELKDLDKNTNVKLISELADNKYLVNYSGLISDNIRRLYSKDSLGLNNEIKTYDRNKLKFSGLNKTRETPSAVHIAAAISSYARILINEYKNIPGNPCIMSDTDSVVLTKPLPNKLIGDNIGLMKLVHNVKKGIFIRKKLYCLIDSDNN